MRMHSFVVTALLATAAACGGDSGSLPGTPSGFLTASDGGDTATGDAGRAAQDAGPDTCDCNGMALPDICMVCTDGQTACAHFVCSAGMCDVQLCP